MHSDDPINYPSRYQWDTRRSIVDREPLPPTVGQALDCLYHPSLRDRDMSESSFPYLRFARLHGLDYGTVLRAADYLGRNSTFGDPTSCRVSHFDRDVEALTNEKAAALAHVIAHEYDRRKARTDGSGG